MRPLLVLGLGLVLPGADAFVPHSGLRPPLARRAPPATAARRPIASAASSPLFSPPNANKGAHTALGGVPGIELSDLLFDSTSTAFDAWEWTANLGAPAALVAGAVLVTLSETREDMAPKKSDKNWIRTVKQIFRFLLLSSFALEVVSIFVGTMTGSVLLSHGEPAAKLMVGYTSPLGLLKHHLEFEYLTIQITFLQGLLNWLCSVALEVIVPKKHEGKSARRMNACMASCLVSLILWILAFYNHHLSFYSDYFSMLRRYVSLFVSRYILCRPIRPLSLLYIPSFAATAVLGWKAFNSPPEDDDDDDDDD